MSGETNRFLLETDNPEVVSALSHALTGAGIPYQTLHPDGPTINRVAFLVPWERMADAHRVAASYLVGVRSPDGFVPDDDDERPVATPPDLPQHFPAQQLQIVAMTVLLHSGLLFWAGSFPSGERMFRLGALQTDQAFAEPWRLLTSIFLHSDLSHVLWNGLAMLVFAVPLLGWLGRSRTVALYLASGVGGALVSSWLSAPGSWVVGSSGAVAGLFGAWVALTWGRSRQERLGWRGYIRTLGVALLVMPSLLSPVSADGQPISVSSHVGGMLTGMVIGAVMSGVLFRRDRSDEPLEIGPAPERLH